MTTPRDLGQLANAFAEAFTQAKISDPDKPLERALETVFAIDDECQRLAGGEEFHLVSAPPPQPAFSLTIRSAARHWLGFIAEVARGHGMTLKDMTGPSRIRSVSTVRHEVMWLMTRQHHVSQDVTAAALHRRDHTSVIWGARRFEILLARDPDLRARMGVTWTVI